MPDDVQVLLNNISSGFDESLANVLITTLLVVIFVGGLLSYWIRGRDRERDSRRERDEARYDALLRSLDLPAGSALLLDRLACYLRNPDRPHLLLESEAAFNFCLRKLRSRESAPPALVAALRLKLGYGASNPEKRPLTSGDIAEGAPVILERRPPPQAEPARRKAVKGRGAFAARERPVEKATIARIKARVLEVRARSIALEAERPLPFDRGEALGLYFFNAAGLYRMGTRVVAVAGSRIELAHSDSIATVQRRCYYRRKLSAPAYLRRAGGEEHFFKTRLQDLGGGGARLLNPYDLFERGDGVEVALAPSAGRWVRISGEIVRVEKDGTISVRFSGLRESTRDLIVRGLFSRYRAFVREREESAIPTSR